MEDKSNVILKSIDLCFMDIIKYPDIFIQKNSTVFIKGKSGSGKSTLLKLFSALENPSSGAVYYNDKNIEESDTIKLRQSILLVPQSFYLFDGNIKENYEEYYRYREREMITDEEIKKYLDICMLDEDLNRDVLTMSGGERQRIFMSVCLSFMPDIMMLDEPTSALDAANAHNMLVNIRAFADSNNMTLITVSHDDKLSSDFADEVITLTGKKT